MSSEGFLFWGPGMAGRAFRVIGVGKSAFGMGNRALSARFAWQASGVVARGVSQSIILCGMARSASVGASLVVVLLGLLWVGSSGSSLTIYKARRWMS